MKNISAVVVRTAAATNPGLSPLCDDTVGVRVGLRGLGVGPVGPGDGASVVTL